MTAGQAEVGLAAAEALAAGLLEERRWVDVCHLVKTIEVLVAYD